MAELWQDWMDVGPPLDLVFFHFWMYIPDKTGLQSGGPSGLRASRWRMAVVTKRTFHNLVLCGSCLPPEWYLLSGLLQCAIPGLCGSYNW